MRVLLLCAHASTRQRVAYALRFEGAEVMEAVRPARLAELAGASAPDLVIIDDRQAERLASELRAKLAQVSIVVALEVVRPCAAATHVWASPIETSRAVALVRRRPQRAGTSGPSSGIQSA